MNKCAFPPPPKKGHMTRPSNFRARSASGIVHFILIKIYDMKNTFTVYFINLSLCCSKASIPFSTCMYIKIIFHFDFLIQKFRFSGVTFTSNKSPQKRKKKKKCLLFHLS